MKSLFSASLPLFMGGVLFLSLLSACEKPETGCDMPPPPICGPFPPADSTCSTLAIVRDKTGLDGCGLVLETLTANGSGQLLEPTGAAWARFHAHDGQRVRLGYRPTEMGSICMVGHVVEVTCIRAAETAGSN